MSNQQVILLFVFLFIGSNSVAQSIDTEISEGKIFQLHEYHEPLLMLTGPKLSSECQIPFLRDEGAYVRFWQACNQRNRLKLLDLLSHSELVLVNPRTNVKIINNNPEINKMKSIRSACQIEFVDHSKEGKFLVPIEYLTAKKTYHRSKSRLIAFYSYATFSDIPAAGDIFILAMNKKNVPYLSNFDTPMVIASNDLDSCIAIERLAKAKDYENLRLLGRVDNDLAGFCLARYSCD